MAGPRLLSESIPKVADKAFKRKYMMLGRVASQWTEIVGEELSGKAQPVKIRYYKHKKSKKPSASLDIACNSADATALHYQKDLILQRINQLFGDDWITAIRFVPKPSNIEKRVIAKTPPPILSNKQKKRIEEMIGDVKDEEVKKRLEMLGQAILKKQEQNQEI